MVFISSFCCKITQFLNLLQINPLPSSPNFLWIFPKTRLISYN